ncbi:putative tubulin polyglutamylase TTLL2 [Pholidichthys leucotaenia]
MAASLVFRLHDKGPKLLREVLLERGWEEYDKEEQEEEDWNLYWRSSAFCSSQYHNLLPWQRLNHHPKTVGITRKDCLARNLRRMRATFGAALYDFSPTAFILPNDYTSFLSEYNKLHLTRGKSVFWICKPVDLSRGKGIFIFEDIRELVYDCSVIVQRYVSHPLLISGYKFDLRIYVCVKSFNPLVIYIHQEGLVRFATEKYSLSSLNNLYAHLTNTSINKFGPFYRTVKGRIGQGCKWTMSKFRHFLRSQSINEHLLWQRINNIVTLTLLAIAPSVPSCPNCVELFGFDILIDIKLKPWLLEVNYSPALTLDCPVDIEVKKGLIGDLIDLMNYTSTDKLRERVFYKRRCKPIHFTYNSPAHVSFKRNRRNKASKFQKLPQLKTHQPVNMNLSRQHGFVADYQRRLPPVHATRNRIIDTTGTKTHADQTTNLILGPQSRTDESAVNRRLFPAPASHLMDNRSLHMSEVTTHDNTETEAKTEYSGEPDSSIPEAQHWEQGVRQSAESWKPNIYSETRTSVRIPVARTTALNGEHIPPIRVGDFIRTFPFNTATLKASQHKLDITIILVELHKLTAQLASGQSDKTQWRREEKKKDTDSDDNFDSLLWGPKDPPLLSQCFTSTENS